MRENNRSASPLGARTAHDGASPPSLEDRSGQGSRSTIAVARERKTRSNGTQRKCVFSAEVLGDHESKHLHHVHPTVSGTHPSPSVSTLPGGYQCIELHHSLTFPACLLSCSSEIPSTLPRHCCFSELLWFGCFLFCQILLHPICGSAYFRQAHFW